MVFGWLSRLTPKTSVINLLIMAIFARLEVYLESSLKTPASQRKAFPLAGGVARKGWGRCRHREWLRGRYGYSTLGE